jgi:hypothetical protein
MIQFLHWRISAKGNTKAEELYVLRTKDIIPYGYPLLDKIKKSVAEVSNKNESKQTLLIAPSWFDGCIFDTCIQELLQELSKLPYKVVLRSHPEFEKKKKILKYSAIDKTISGNGDR